MVEDKGCTSRSVSSGDVTTKKIPVEVYSRIVGYFRPTNQWNIGKREEFNERKSLRIRNIESSSLYERQI